MVSMRRNNVARPAALAAVTALLLAGCTGGSRSMNHLPTGAQSYEIFPPNTQAVTPTYHIGPSDILSVNVFNEPELSMAQVRVDASGHVSLPLVGQVEAQGKTSEELARVVESRLTPRYVVNPRVAVNVIETVASRVTIEGEVNQPGVFPLTGPTTLLDVVAMARGTTRLADHDQVAIFRVINGQQMAARFDLARIRSGELPNPALQNNDIVVVGFSRLNSAWRDFLSTVPVLTLFSRF